jgi:Sensors of blue-light using FAD
MVDQEPDLTFVAYASAASAPFTGEALGDLLLRARSKNLRLGLTGMLLYHQESFFQVLEGPPAAVAQIFERISADARHIKVAKLIQEPIEQRSFSEWTMGLGQPDRDELGAIPGLNDFFRQGSCLWELEPGRARTLLNAFRDGKWRRTVGN